MRTSGWRRLAIILATALLALTPAQASAQPTLPYCGPVDIVFVYDDTATMDGPVLSLKLKVQEIVATLETTSNGGAGPDYRIAFVTFKDNVTVRQNFFPGNGQDFINSVLDSTWRGAYGGVGLGDASDEAINTVVNMLPASARPLNQVGDFTSAFRSVVNGNIDVRRFLILVTDSPPGGFTDDFQVPADPDRAHVRAVEAAAKSIKIISFFPGPGHQEGIPIMEDYALTTGGYFLRTDEPVLIPVGDAILNYLKSCPAAPNKPPIALCGSDYQMSCSPVASNVDTGSYDFDGVSVTLQ